MSGWLNRLLFQMYPYYETFYQGGLRGLGEATCVGLFLAALTFYLVGSLTLIPAYFLTKQIADKETAFFAAAFVGFIPSILLFSPAFDQIFPALALLYSFFLIKAIRSRRIIFAILAGLVLSVWSFLQLSFLVMMALSVFALLLYFFALPERKKRIKENFQPTLKIAAGLAVGFLVPNLLLFFLRYNAFQVFWINLRENSKIYSLPAFPRTYWKWALLAIPDFFLFMGVPAACIFLWALRLAYRSLVKERRLEIAGLTSLALMLTLFLIAVWGQNKGEVARLLMFLGPIATVLGLAISHQRARLSRRTLLALLLLLAVQLILFRLFFDIWYSQDLIRRGEFG
jgi:asparagine N-glycosylation enzyme membrane subunit Stt3